MTSLSNKPLFNQFISSLVFFLLVIILDFICSSTAYVSSVTSPFVYTNNKVKVAEERKEAKALLKWKTNLHSKSQSFLPSWTGSNPCNWVGINCDKSGSVTHLNLSSYHLRGTLHNLSFQSFPNLLSVDLSYNSLFGTIPSNIVHLSKLSALNLSHNQFTGRIPSKTGQLTSLHVFYLAANHMSGLIPQELGGLTSLNELDLSSNNLTGTIPASLGNLSNITTLYLYRNQLFGSIPQELGMLSSLTDLELSINSLTGTIGYTAPEHAYTMEVSENFISVYISHLHCSSSTHPSLHLTIGASMPVDQSSSTQMEAELSLFCGPKALKGNQNTGFELIIVSSHLLSFFLTTQLIDKTGIKTGLPLSLLL
nr:putative leucine-rich repeat receptor-like protein kinase [Quercus suber]